MGKFGVGKGGTNAKSKGLFTGSSKNNWTTAAERAARAELQFIMRNIRNPSKYWALKTTRKLAIKYGLPVNMFWKWL